ncbi:MAG: type II toxin-antitoxin system HicA family toxin [Synechococcales bacterium]|nr:type II toxin-antitoxin system HicA family toxin [Synechococcales bacterium]
MSVSLNSKLRKTLGRIFQVPVPSDLPWRDIVVLFEGLGADVSQGRGSRVRVFLNGEVATFHEPHPERVAPKGQVKAVKEFLKRSGIAPE